jgi:hypothetical protein
MRFVGLRHSVTIMDDDETEEFLRSPDRDDDDVSGFPTPRNLRGELEEAGGSDEGDLPAVPTVDFAGASAGPAVAGVTPSVATVAIPSAPRASPIMPGPATSATAPATNAPSSKRKHPDPSTNASAPARASQRLGKTPEELANLSDSIRNPPRRVMAASQSSSPAFATNEQHRAAPPPSLPTISQSASRRFNIDRTLQQMGSSNQSDNGIIAMMLMMDKDKQDREERYRQEQLVQDERNRLDQLEREERYRREDADRQRQMAEDRRAHQMMMMMMMNRMGGGAPVEPAPVPVPRSTSPAPSFRSAPRDDSGGNGDFFNDFSQVF